MESALVMTAVVLLASKLVELAKYIRNKDKNAALTLVILMVVGVVVVCLAAAADATSALVLPGMVEPLGDLDFASLIFVGLIFTSLVSKIYDFQKAFDQSDSAKQPPLIN